MSDATSDSVNDIAGSGEPSFVHVAICTGTAMDGSGVTLVDRLCLNDPAVRLIDGDMKICNELQQGWTAMVDEKDAEIASLNKDITMIIIAAVVVYAVLTVAFTTFLFRKA